MTQTAILYSDGERNNTAAARVNVVISAVNRVKTDAFGCSRCRLRLRRTGSVAIRRSKWTRLSISQSRRRRVLRSQGLRG